MFKLIKKEIGRLGPKEAAAFLAINTLDDQRPLKERHLNYLKRTMENDLFLTAEIAVAQLNYNGKEKKLVNGQHTCTAVTLVKKPISALIEHFEVETADDLALLYRQFDAHASRTLGDILRPEATALGLNWPPRLINLTVSAATLREGKFALHKSEKVELLKKYLQFGKFLVSLLYGKDVESKNAKMLTRAPIAHAIMLCWEKAQEDSKKFWISVRDGVDLKHNDPALKLRNYLMQTAAAWGGCSSFGFKSATYHEITSKSINA
jgi:hypothetical protein